MRRGLRGLAVAVLVLAGLPAAVLLLVGRGSWSAGWQELVGRLDERPIRSIDDRRLGDVVVRMAWGVQVLTPDGATTDLVMAHGLGTGLTADGYFLTTRSSVEGVLKLAAATTTWDRLLIEHDTEAWPMFWVVEGDGSAVVEARLVRAFGGVDLALLKVDGREDRPFLNLSSAADRGEDVVAFGRDATGIMTWPMSEVDAVVADPGVLLDRVASGRGERIGPIAALRAVVGRVRGEDRADDGTSFVRHTIEPGPGLDGAPLVSTAGEVVALFTYEPEWTAGQSPGTFAALDLTTLADTIASVIARDRQKQAELSKAMPAADPP